MCHQREVSAPVCVIDEPILNMRRKPPIGLGFAGDYSIVCACVLMCALMCMDARCSSRQTLTLALALAAVAGDELLSATPSKHDTHRIRHACHRTNGTNLWP